MIKKTIDTFGQPLWLVDDIICPTDGYYSTIQNFITEYHQDSFSLSLFDTSSNETVEIDCPVDQIADIASTIFLLEKGFPLTFIALNHLTESYIIGFTFARGRIKSGCYKYQNNQLIRIL